MAQQFARTATAAAPPRQVQHSQQSQSDPRATIEPIRAAPSRRNRRNMSPHQDAGGVAVGTNTSRTNRASRTLARVLPDEGRVGRSSTSACVVRHESIISATMRHQRLCGVASCAPAFVRRRGCAGRVHRIMPTNAVRRTTTSSCRRTPRSPAPSRPGSVVVLTNKSKPHLVAALLQAAAATRPRAAAARARQRTRSPSPLNMWIDRRHSSSGSSRSADGDAVGRHAA